MKKIKNPNEIVDSFVSDYSDVFGDQLVSVIMYGSAVTHEYKPGVSDINIAIVLTDNSIPQIIKSLAIQKKWQRKNVTTPFFLTKDYIATSCDTYPIEFLDMQSDYRVLYGEDVLENIKIQKEHIRLQCERELKGIAVHLRRSFVQCTGSNRMIFSLLFASIHRLIPIFKGLLMLKDNAIPKSKSDIVSMVEDSYDLGASAFSKIYNSNKKNLKKDIDKHFDMYARDIDKLIALVDMIQ